MSEYFTVLTHAGAAAIAAAQPGGTLNISEMAISTGGANYNPTIESMKAQTQLIDEVSQRYAISEFGETTDESTYFIQAVVPVEHGGWTVREVGWFLDDGTLFAVTKYPPTEKTMPNSGAGIEIPIKAHIKISNDVNVSITLDQSAVFATHNYVNTALKKPWINESLTLTLYEKNKLTTATAKKMPPTAGLNGNEWLIVKDFASVKPRIDVDDPLAEKFRRLQDGAEDTFVNIQTSKSQPHQSEIRFTYNKTDNVWEF